MKKWLVVAAFGIVAGCQAGTTSTASQALGGADCDGTKNFCDAKMGDRVDWKPGDPIPKVTADTVVLIGNDSKDVWGAYAADLGSGSVLWHVSLKDAEMTAFQGLLRSKDQPYGGVRGPVGGCYPNCGGDPFPAGFLLAAALRLRDVQKGAEDDFGACVSGK